MASLVSRRLMRVVLWLLLASVFVYPGVVGLHIIATTVPLTEHELLFLSAGLLLLSLWLFPLAWTRVRDMGDQVLYRDFYQYNRSLRELSTTLTRFQGLEQISAFALPRLAHLLNATEIALIVRPSMRTPLCCGTEENPPWQIYRQPLAAQLAVLEVNSRYLAQAQDDAQRLAALNHRVVSAQEEERRHLALDLHDEALQQAMLVVRQLSDASTMTEVAEVMPLARSVME